MLCRVTTSRRFEGTFIFKSQANLACRVYLTSSKRVAKVNRKMTLVTMVVVKVQGHSGGSAWTVQPELVSGMLIGMGWFVT